MAPTHNDGKVDERVFEASESVVHVHEIPPFCVVSTWWLGVSDSPLSRHPAWLNELLGFSRHPGPHSWLRPLAPESLVESICPAHDARLAR